MKAISGKKVLFVLAALALAEIAICRMTGWQHERLQHAIVGVSEAKGTEVEVLETGDDDRDAVCTFPGEDGECE